MSLRRAAAQSLADTLGAQITLAQPATVLTAPPSDATQYPALAVMIDRSKINMTQSWELMVDSSNNPLVGFNAKLEAPEGSVSARMIRAGSIRCEGRIWLGARHASKREEMEERVIAAFFQDDSAHGLLFSTMVGVKICDFTIPWPWTVGSELVETTWSSEFVFSERVWSWIRFRLDVDMLVPRTDPLVQTFILELSAGMKDDPDDPTTPADETLTLDAGGNLVPYSP